MKLTGKMSVNIPFSGFYNTLYDGEIDRYMEMTTEHDAEAAENMARPSDMRLTVDDYAEALSAALNYRAACSNIAKTYAEIFSDKASEMIGVKLNLGWEEMTSPRFYNFETDRIFCSLSYATVLRLFALSKRDKHRALRTAIERRFTSYDGFSSGYSNRLAAWLAKPLASWDHNEIGTLLVAALERSPDYDESEFDMEVYYIVTDDSCFQEMDPAIDWDKYYTLIAEMAVNREAEFMAEFPDYVPPVPRCAFTPDLFTGKAGE